jgi:hypothetical protein
LLGELQMRDLLRVRREAVVRELFVYLFKEAIICVAEERRRTIGRLVQSVSGGSGTHRPKVCFTSRAAFTPVTSARSRTRAPTASFRSQST